MSGNIAIGSLLLIGGIALSIVTPNIIFVGAIGVGLLQIVIGLMKLGAGREGKDPFPEQTLDFKALLRVLMGAAEKRGPFDEPTAAVIQSIMLRFYGKECDRAIIDKARDAFWGQGGNLMAYLVEVCGRLTPEFRRAMVAAAALTIGQGKSLTEDQREFVGYVSNALQLPERDLDAVISYASRFELLLAPRAAAG
jgi:hypothetical protein